MTGRGFQTVSPKTPGNTLHRSTTTSEISWGDCAARGLHHLNHSNNLSHWDPPQPWPGPCRQQSARLNTDDGQAHEVVPTVHTWLAPSHGLCIDGSHHRREELCPCIPDLTLGPGALRSGSCADVLMGDWQPLNREVQGKPKIRVLCL